MWLPATHSQRAHVENFLKNYIPSTISHEASLKIFALKVKAMLSHNVTPSYLFDLIIYLCA